MKHITHITEIDGKGSHVHVSTGDVLNTGLTILGIALLMDGRGCVASNDAREPHAGLITPVQELVEL